MDDKEKGLYKKYNVSRVDGKPMGWCFVLEEKDPRAIPALEAYAISAREVGYQKLYDDLKIVIEKMQGTLK